jgi:hypothetical protein
MNATVKERFPSYSLFVYKEGYIDASSLRVKGYPVIFVPGNAGSYKQVRSMASIANQMYNNRQTSGSVELDFFTVDFNEEKAAIFGPLLENQVNFLLQVIQRVREVYKSSGRSFVSCILIGHSIGGIISRGLLIHPSFNARCVDLLLTLSAPLKEPVVSFDGSITNFYHKTNIEWNRQRHIIARNKSNISNTTHVSIGGGFSDVMVRSQLAYFDSSDNDIDFATISTGIPDVWLSVDHLCIVWCRELMIKITHLLFDIVNLGNRDSVQKKSIITYHLEEVSRGKIYAPSRFIPNKIVYPQIGEWINVDDRAFRWTSKTKVIKPVFFLVKLVPKTTIVLWVDGETRTDWASGCKISSNTVKRDKNDEKNAPICESGINLSHLTKMWPSLSIAAPSKSPKSSMYIPKKRKRTLMITNADSILSQGVTHINVALSPTTDYVSVSFERFSQFKRNIAVILPTVIQSLTMLFSFITIKDIPVSDQASYFYLSIIGQEQVWHVYSVKVSRGSCYSAAEESRTRELSRFSVPWSREDSFTSMTSIDEVKPLVSWKKFETIDTLLLKLNVPKPSVSDKRSPSLELLLDPDCSYQIQIKLHFFEMLGHLIRFYYQYLFQLILAIFISVLGIQFTLSRSNRHLVPSEDDELEYSTGNSPVFYHESTERALRRRFFRVSLFGLIPLFPWLAIKVTKHVFDEDTIKSSKILQYFMSLEMNSLEDTQFILLFTVIFIFSYSISYFISIIMQSFLAVLTKCLLLVKKNVNPGRSLPCENWSFSFTPVITGLIFMLISFATTSNVGMVLTTVTHSIRLLKLSVKSHLLFERRGLNPQTSILHYHMTILWLLLMSSAASFPLTIYWVFEGYPFFFAVIPSSRYLHLRDDQLLSSLAITITMMFIWQEKPIRAVDQTRSQVRQMGYKIVISSISLLSGLLGHNIHFIPYLIVIPLSILSFLTINTSNIRLGSSSKSNIELFVNHDHQE